jgi:hypothetical protein
MEYPDDNELAPLIVMMANSTGGSLTFSGVIHLR